MNEMENINCFKNRSRQMRFDPEKKKHVELAAREILGVGTY